MKRHFEEEEKDAEINRLIGITQGEGGKDRSDEGEEKIDLGKKDRRQTVQRRESD